MKSSVIVFPGSNCDRDIAFALNKFQIKNQMVWHDEANLPKSDLVSSVCSDILHIVTRYTLTLKVRFLPCQNMLIDQ